MVALEKARADRMDFEALFARFEHMVMRPHSDGFEARIVKWVDPVNVKVIGRVENSLLQSLPAKIPFVADFIDHDVQFDSGAAANMTFLFAPNVFDDVKGKWRPAALTLLQKNERLLDTFVADGERDGLGCHSQQFINLKKSTMVYSVAFVSTDRPLDAPIKVDQAWCFWTYLIKGLGFMGDLTIEFAPGETQAEALPRHSELMNLFLRFLYQPEVAPGMEASEVKPIFMEFMRKQDLTAVTSKQ